MIKVSLASRSSQQLDQIEAAMRLMFDVPDPAETGPKRHGKHRRFLTVHLPEPLPEESPCTYPPLPT